MRKSESEIQAKAPPQGVYILRTDVPNPRMDRRRLKEWIYGEFFPKGWYYVKRWEHEEREQGRVWLRRDMMMIEYLGARHGYIDAPVPRDGIVQGQAAALAAALEPDSSLEGWLLAKQKLEYLSPEDVLLEIGKSLAGEALVRAAAEQVLRTMQERDEQVRQQQEQEQ